MDSCVVGLAVVHLHLRYVFLRFLNGIGMLCLYAGLFLHEDEEGRFQNRIQQWWVKVDDLAKVSHSRAATFMREIARLAGAFLDRLFGSPIRPLRLVGVSVCFSIASFCLSALLSIAFVGTAKFHPSVGKSILWLIYFLFLALMPAISTDKWYLRIWGSAVLIQLLPLLRFLLFLGRRRGPLAGLLGFEVVSVLLVVSLIFDLLYLYVTRTALKYAAKVERTYHIVLLAILDVLALGIALVLPWVVGLAVFRYAKQLGITILFSFFLNSVDVLVCSVALIIAFLLLLDRLIWPLIQRPIYATQRFAVIRNKKALIGWGIALITLPTNTIGGMFLRLLGKIF